MAQTGRPLAGKTIAVTEARRGAELATLVARLGGVPYAAPALREVPVADRGPALAALEQVCGGQVGVIAFLTGVGTRAFFALADTAGRRPALLQALGRMVVAARGPKPAAALREAGVRVDVLPAEPTSEALLAALAARDLRGRAVAVQRYGGDAPALVEGLLAGGARVLEIPLYEWALPLDVGPLRRLVVDAIEGRVDVVAFTSSPQVRHLFAVAREVGREAELGAALRERVTVASIGPVCDAALEAHGVSARVRPARGTLGALVHAIAEYLQAAAV